MIRELSNRCKRFTLMLTGNGTADAASDVAVTSREALSCHGLGLSFQLSLITGMQILVSFAIQWYVVAQLGAGVQTDALYAGNTLPQVITSLAIDTLTFVLVPLLAPKPESELAENGWQLLIGVGVVFTAIAGLLHLIIPLLVPILVPGLSIEGKRLAASLSRIQILGIIGTACYAVLSALHQVRQRFLWPALSLLLSSLTGMALLLWKLHHYGVHLAAWVQLLVMTLAPLLQLRILGKFSQFRFDFGMLKLAFRQMRPLVLGACYYRTNFIVDRLLASFLAPGSIVILELAQKTQSAIVRILNQGLITPIVPKLATLAGAGRWKEFRSLSGRKSLEMLLVTSSIVLAVAFLMLAHPQLAKHFVGRLSPQAVDRLLAVFLYMSGVLLGSGLNHTFMNSYYAAGNTVIPTKIGVYTYTLGVALKIAGFFLAGLTGIAFAISLSTLVQAVLLFSFLQPQRLPAFTKHAWEKPQAGQHLPQHGTEDWPVPEPALKDYQPFVEDPAPDL